MKKNIILAASALAVTALALGWLLWGPAREAPRESPTAPPAEDAQSHSASVAGDGGVPSRPTHPASSAPMVWLDEGVDPKTMRTLVDQAPPLHKVLQEDYGTYGHLDGWSEGYIDDSDLGKELLACRLAHERKQKGDCHWGQALVLRRDGDEGVVQYTEVRHRGNTPRCRALMDCVASAYRGKRVPWPDDPELGEHLVLKNGVYGVGDESGAQLNPDGYIAMYRKILQEAREQLRSATALIERDGPHAPLLHMKRGAEQRIRDAEAMLDGLGVDP